MSKMKFLCYKLFCYTRLFNTIVSLRIRKPADLSATKRASNMRKKGCFHMYHGLPLRREFRIKVLLFFTDNYWCEEAGNKSNNA